MKVRELIKYLGLFDAEADVVFPANSATGEERLTKEHIRSGLGVLIFDQGSAAQAKNRVEVKRLKRVVVKLNDRINQQDSDGEIQQLEAVITRLIDQAIRGAAENAQLKRDNARLKGDNVVVVKRSNDWSRRIHEQHTEIGQLKCTITRLKEEKTNDVRQLGCLESNYKMKHARVVELKCQVARLGEEKNKMDKELNEQHTEIGQLKCTIAQLGEDNAVKTRQLNSYGYRVHEQHTEIGQLKCAIANLNIKISRSQEISLIENLKASIAVLETKLVEKVQRLKELRAGETCEYEQRLQRQRIEIQQLLKVNERNRGTRKYLDKTHVRILELSIAFSKLEKENEQLKEENGRLTQEMLCVVHRCQNQPMKLTCTATKVLELKKENQKLADEIQRLREQSGEMVKCLDGASAKILELRAANGQHLIQQLREQNAAMVSIVNTSCARILELSKENSQLKKLDKDQNAAILLLMEENERLDNLLNVRAEQLEKRIEQLESDEMEDNAETARG